MGKGHELNVGRLIYWKTVTEAGKVAWWVSICVAQMWNLNLNHQNPHRSWRQSVNILHPRTPTERWEVRNFRVPGSAWQEGKNQLSRLFEHHTNLIVCTSAHIHRHKQEQPLSHRANSISNPILGTIDVHRIHNKYGTCTVTLPLDKRWDPENLH